jgi:hypothetical protein
LDYQGKHFQDRWQGQMSVYLTLKLHEGKDISWNIYVDESDARLNSYDMIIGRDLLHELGIYLLFSFGVMKWDNTTVVPMRDPSQLRDSNIDDIKDEIFSMHDPATIDAAMSSILQQTFMKWSLSAIT